MGWADTMAQVEVQVEEAKKAELPWILVDLELARQQVIQRLKEKDEPLADPLLTVAQLATKLQVSPATLYQRISRGQMKATRIGRCVRVTEKDFVRSLPRGPRVKRLIDL
jgi:excisionase family DNA binding protein